MRVALAPGGDLIRRTGRVLLADPRVAVVGVHHEQSGDPRVVAVDDLGAFDVVVAEEFGLPETKAAWNLGVPIVIADRLSTPDTRHVITDGADLEGLARALADLARRRHPDGVVEVSWTTHGRPIKTGRRIVFPAPVGPLYARHDDSTSVAPHEGDFSAILVHVSARTEAARYGVVDQANYLAAICLAASVLAMDARTGGPAAALGDRLVQEAIRAGVSVAHQRD